MSTKIEENTEFETGANGVPINNTTQANPPDDDDDDDVPSSGKTQKERRKIEIKFIQDKSRRHITFSKRKAGIMKKAYELSVLTGTQVLLLVVSETGLVYTFTTPKLQPLVTKPEGKNLIQACLNAPEEGLGGDQDQSDGEQADSPEQSPAPGQQQQQQQQAQAQQQQQHAQLQQQQQAAAAAAAAQHHQQQPQQMQPIPGGGPHGIPQYGNPGAQGQQPGQPGQPGNIPYGDYAYFSNMQNSNIPNQQQYQ
ncbi:MCM1 [Candida margitis]|uniref:MCM1 n=1 Tax=Candida margitis TaxID=1775924 RepID=UPI002227ADBC|nr:MCM1 [Candida margitis]KAI5970742.1 MCM1 [Candida margitis]